MTLHLHHVETPAVPSIVDVTVNLPGDFKAYNRALEALRTNGFSVGRMEAHSPTGILFGDFDIQKWRNLSRDDRIQLHGTITGSCRHGPCRVFVLAPNADVAERVREALTKAEG